MKLYLGNIGRLSNTEIIIDGITSMEGKSLYSINSSFYD